MNKGSVVNAVMTFKYFLQNVLKLFEDSYNRHRRKDHRWKNFWNCSGLMDIYCYAETVPQRAVDHSFMPSHYDAVMLYVPVALIKDYKLDNPWSKFNNIVAIP